MDVEGDTELRGYLKVNTDDLYVDDDNHEVGIDTSSPVTTLDVNGGLATNIVSHAQDYTATSSDFTILADASGDSVRIFLPAASGCTGQILVIFGNNGLTKSAIIIINQSLQVK